MANVIAQIQAMIASLEAQYGGAKASVNQAYDKYTGDVLTSGRDWMKDLYGRIVDPNDPNAALMQKDPALTNYAQSMSQIEETSGQNRATDLAWFDKTMQNQKDMLSNMAIQMAAQQALGVGGSGGGGGGGGGRGRGGGGGGYSRRSGGRRYYSSGGSGGGGGGDWKDPKTTHTASETGTETGTVSQYGPGIEEEWASVLGASKGYDYGTPEFEAWRASPQFEQDYNSPEGQALLGYFQHIWEKSDQTPRGVTAATSKLNEENIAKLAQQQVMQTANQQWENLMPANTQAAVQQLAINDPAIRFTPNNLGTSAIPVEQDGRITMQPAPLENYTRPIPEGQSTPPVYQPTAEQGPQDTLAKQLLALESPEFNASQRIASPLNPTLQPKQYARSGAGASNAGYIPGLINPNVDVPSVVNPDQAAVMRQAGARQWTEALKGHNAKDNPFNIEDYIGTGGFVPGVSQTDIDQAQQESLWQNMILQGMLPLNPNAVPAPTRYTDVTKDESKVGTTSSTYDPNAAVQGTPEETPTGLPPGLATSPLTPPTPSPVSQGEIQPYDPNANPNEFDDTGTEEMVTPGEGLRFRVNSQLKNVLDKRAKERDAATAAAAEARANAIRAAAYKRASELGRSRSGSSTRLGDSYRRPSSSSSGSYHPSRPSSGPYRQSTPGGIPDVIDDRPFAPPVLVRPGNSGFGFPDVIDDRPFSPPPPPVYRPPIQRRFGGY